MENQYGRIQVSYFIIIILTLISPGGSDLGRGLRDRRKNLHKGRVLCKLQDCIFRLFFIIFYFI